MFNKSSPSRLEDRSVAPTRTFESTRDDFNGDFKTAPPVLKEIDRFEIHRELGRGGFGTVYLAFDQVLKRQIALKLPLLSLEGRKRAKESLLREARAAAGLRHPNVVTIYDVGEANGTLYVAMEYVEGGTLRDRISQGPLCPTEAASIMAKVAEAIHQAHQQGLVHRDLKPSNILLTPSGEPKVSDFGLMVYEDERASQQGEVSGTYPYMSPEQLSGKTTAVDGRSDIWSLGIILYECLTGRRPFLAKDTEELVEEIAEGEVKPPRQINDTIPAELEQLCLQCLQKSPLDRPSNAADVARALRRFAQQPARWKQRTVAGVLAVIVVLLVSLGWWLRQPLAEKSQDNASRKTGQGPGTVAAHSGNFNGVSQLAVVPSKVRRISLLEQKPVPVLFPRLLTNAFYRVETLADNRKIFSANTGSTHGLIGFVRHQSGTFRVKLRMLMPYRDNSTSRLGIFWGYHLNKVDLTGIVAIPNYLFRSITVDRSTIYPRKLHLEVGYARITEHSDGGINIRDRHVVRRTFLPPPKDDIVILEAEIKDGTPAMIRCQGKEIPFQYEQKFKAQGKIYCQGVAGLFVLSRDIVSCTQAELVFPLSQKE